MKANTILNKIKREDACSIATAELLTKAENRFSLVIATSKRARQISEGSEVLTDEDDVSPVSLAADEIAEGKVKIC